MKMPTAKQLFYSILLIAFLLRLPYFFYSLAYDEIWTITNFIQLPAGKLFFDLSLPNNHPLNSILVKWMYALPMAVEYIRLPHLLAGVLSVVLAGYLAKRMAGRNAGLWSMGFMAANAPLIVYSAQARGYALQVFFLLAFAASVIKSVEYALERKRAVLINLAVILSAWAAVMTLSTSVLYLAGISVILWNYYNWKLIPRKSLLTLLIAALGCGIYILMNLNDLAAARQWGSAIGSIPEYFRWLGGVLYAILPGVLTLLVICCIKYQLKYMTGYGIFFVLLFGSAIFTNGGPARVYLPLCALFCIAAGAGTAAIQEKVSIVKMKKLLLVAVLLFTAINYFYQLKEWRFPNYLTLITQLDTLPQGALTVYPAGDSYSVLWSSKGRAADLYTANFISRNVLSDILIINSPGRINGADKNYNEKALPLPLDVPIESIANIPVQRLHLKRIYENNPDNKKPLIAVCSTAYKSTFKEYEACMYNLAKNPGGVLHLNCWFSYHGENYAEKIYCGTWYIAPGAMTPEGLKNIQEFAVLYYLQK